MLGVLRAGLLSAVGVVKQAYADAVTALHPVAYWRLDETSGSTIVDHKGVQNGTYVGSIEYAVDPLVRDSIDSSVGFDGSTAYGRIPHNAALASAQGAIAFAFQPDSVAGQHLLVAKEVPGGGAGGLTVEINDGRLRAFLKDDTGTAVWLPDTGGAADVAINTAYHVAITWGSRGAELWLNGVLVASDPSLTTGLGANTHDLLLAAYPGPAALADGVMDEVAFFDRQLTADQVQTLARPLTIDHMAPVSQALPSAPSANAYWVDPINGNDSATAGQARSSTTSPSANPWKTLSRAINQWNAGNLSASASGHVEIILRGGLSYERGNDLTITRSASSGTHLVIKGYRNDIQAGTRGGTGKYTGAKGRFVLRGNIQSLEGAGWEDDPTRGRNIYRSSSTFTINGKPWANWLRPNTYNLQLVPARNIGDLDTDTTDGAGSAVYSGPGISEDGGRFHVRMDTNEWTDYWNPEMLSPAASWVTNPNTETLAVYDETHGIRFEGNISFVDFAFFNVEYWWRAINTNVTSTVVTDFTMDYVTIKGGFHAIRFRELSEARRIEFTHCDFIMNIPPWAARAWIHGTPVQGRWDSFFVFVQAEDTTDDVLVEHCRFVRSTDGYTQPDNSSIVSNVIFRNNHILNCRDDVMAFSVSAYNIEITYNYFQDSFLGVGGYAGSVGPANKDGWKIGFNVFDQRTYTNITGYNFEGAARFEPGASNNPSGGTGCGRADPMHGAPNVWHERHWYHNTLLVAQDRNTTNGSTNAFGYKTEDGAVDTANPSTHYNNVIVQTNRCSVLGGVRANTLERDYNCSWVDPAGLLWNSVRVCPRRSDGAVIQYDAWDDFLNSGTHYDQTKHNNGPGPGSPSGWDANGKFADPDFVNGKWESIVRGDLSTYFPQVNGNLKFAVSLTGTGWPGCDQHHQYVGAYQPGDPVNKIGPEQGLWMD